MAADYRKELRMRLSFNVALSLVILAALAAEILSLGDALEYRQAVAFSEPWRLLTAHFVHLSFLHSLLNCVALVLLARLF